MVARQVDHERGRAVIGYGEWERPRLRGVPKYLVRQFGGAGNGDPEVTRQQAYHPHPPRLLRRVLETPAEGAAGVLYPFLVGSNGSRELRPGEGWGWLAPSHRHLRMLVQNIPDFKV